MPREKRDKQKQDKARCNFADGLLSSLETIITSPGTFLGPAQEETNRARGNSKVLYDNSCSIDTQITSDASKAASVPVLNELYISGFDSEQIWQQIDHRFNIVTDENYIGELSKLLTDTAISLDISTDNSAYHNGHTATGSASEASDDEEVEEYSDDLSGDSDHQMEVDDADDLVSEEEEEEDDDEVSHAVNDSFFSLKKMEAFLDLQDAELMKDPEKFERLPELYESDDNDAEEQQYMFRDLFGDDKAASSKNKTSGLQAKLKALASEGKSDSEEERDEELSDDDEGDERTTLGAAGDDDDLSDDDMQLMKALEREQADDDDMSGEEEEGAAEEESEEESDAEHLEDIIGRQKHEPSKSEYEKRTEKMRERIEAMEGAAMSADKPWQLKGEVTAKTRPENSLLQEDVEFDSNVAPVPVITVETTQDLESLIIQRIKDKAFDDVERKTRLKEDGERFKKRIDLDHEKSKLSLSQIYEQEYIKLRDQDDDDEEKEDPAEVEIKQMMTSLFSKLEALSSFQYTPKPAAKEVKIISQLPALVVEEVQPDTVADAARLAPEEVKKPKVEVKDRSEMDDTDKKRIRRTKKAKLRKNEELKKKIEERVKKLAPGLGNKRAEQRSIEAIKEAVIHKGKVINPTKQTGQSDKVYSSSKEFFKALQNEVKMDKKVTKKKVDAKKWIGAKSAEKLKL